MAQLVVLGVDNRDDVERLFDLAGDLAKQELQLQDHAFPLRPSDRAPGVEVTDEGSTKFVEVVAEALGLPKLQVLQTGGDVYQSERQQWDSGNNAVALEPGVIFTTTATP
jgi:arginine deiminase